MKMRLNLAIRNIFRHKGRTAVGLTMVVGAVIGLVLFEGFSAHIMHAMERVVIENQYGHIQVAERAFWNLEPGSRKTQLMADSETLSRKLASDPAVTTIAGRLSFFGLISSGEVTVSAKGMGFDPSKEVEFNDSLIISQGERLKKDAKLEVLLGLGLQKKVNVPVGGTLTVLSYTLDGVVNAVDLTVKGIFMTGNSEIDDNLFVLPLSTTQNLLDTDRVEVLSIRLKETGQTNAARDRLQKLAVQSGAGYQAKTWYELSLFYRQVEAFYRTQNTVIMIILLSLVFLGILNTVGMSVFERTGEIGTVRSLGETGRAVVAQFALEGMILGILGAILGAIAGVILSTVISSLHIMMELPGTSTPVPILIKQVPGAYAKAMFVVMLAATAATWWPSVRASKMSIVEALKKNI